MTKRGNIICNIPKKCHQRITKYNNKRNQLPGQRHLTKYFHWPQNCNDVNNVYWIRRVCTCNIFTEVYRKIVKIDWYYSSMTAYLTLWKHCLCGINIFVYFLCQAFWTTSYLNLPDAEKFRAFTNHVLK